MEIKDQNKFGKLDEQRLWLFEKTIGNRLPEDYRSFLIEYNGGKPFPNHFKISEEQGDDNLHNVYGLHDGPSYASIEDHYNVYLNRMPRSIIPFADDPSGNAICIGISSSERGKIFFWNHDFESAENAESYFGNIALISNSFSDFLGSLYEWIDPNETAIKRALKKDDITLLCSLLKEILNLEEEDEYGRTLIENAAIHNATEIIRYLYGKGAKLRNALKYAEENANYFEEHKRSVDLIKSLQGEDGTLLARLT